jgi:lactoylglutathione lyase
MRLEKIDHITINLDDLSRSLEFYQDLLGLRRLDTVDMGDHVLHYFQLPGDCRLELIEYRPPARFGPSAVTDRGTYRHLALQVDDLDELQRRCVRFGATVKMPPMVIAKLGFRNMLVQDPNGVEIEFLERL